MYPSTTTRRSVGSSGSTAACSWTWLTRLRAEPASRRNVWRSQATASSSPSSPIFSERSLRNSPTATDRSNDRGSISPVHDGTVGLRPEASLTYTLIPRTRRNWYVRPPRTNTSLGLRYSTNFSLRSPSGDPRSEITWYEPSSGIVPTFV